MKAKSFGILKLVVVVMTPDRQADRILRVCRRGRCGCGDAYVVVVADLRCVDAPLQFHDVLSLQQIFVLWQIPPVNTGTT